MSCLNFDWLKFCLRNILWRKWERVLLPGCLGQEVESFSDYFPNSAMYGLHASHGLEIQDSHICLSFTFSDMGTSWMQPAYCSASEITPSQHNKHTWRHYMVCVCKVLRWKRTSEYFLLCEQIGAKTPCKHLISSKLGGQCMFIPNPAWLGTRYAPFDTLNFWKGTKDNGKENGFFHLFSVEG